MEEAAAFAIHINNSLEGDELLQDLLPLDEETGQDLFTKNQNGLLLIRMLNLAKPDAIPLSAVNKWPRNIYQKIENLNVALRAAKTMGCSVVNVGSQDFMEGR